MFFKPRCSPEAALDQAGSTAAKFLGTAKATLDARFGTGYAAKNPELLVALIYTQAYDFRTTVMLDGNYEISEALRGIASRGL